MNSSLLRYAAESRPLIVLRTSDPGNAGQVIWHITNREPGRIPIPAQPELWLAQLRTAISKCPEETLLILPWRAGLEDVDWFLVRNDLASMHSCMVLVNPEIPIPGAFDVGELHTPASLLRSTVAEIVTSPNHIDAVTHCVGGLTLGEAIDVMRIAEAKHHAVTPDSVKDVRSSLNLPRRGVHLIAPSQEYYRPPEAIREWVIHDGKTLTSSTLHPDARPRGVLLHGVPGTGKTAAARYFAQELEVALFRLDIGMVQSKYVGESEAYLSNALSYIANSEPCVLLVDEVEKLFAGQDDSGVTRKMLAGLLWWLQEHRSKVLTVMTTNSIDALPDELYRPGRIDAVLRLEGFKTYEDCLSMMGGYFRYLCPESENFDRTLHLIWAKRADYGAVGHGTGCEYTPAELRELVKRYVRRNNS